MHMTNIPFGITNWANVKSERHKGENGWADWKVCQFGDIRVRLLEYSPEYKADHWCTKGHILFCLEGELIIELEDGRQFVLQPGMSYQVADGADPHRSYTTAGAKLFVVD
jgi:quercetin dioxygenase-like cupin family protein